jgi:protein phosphatase
VVQELIDAGELSPADAARHPERSVVTRALGSQPAPAADFWLLPADRSETFLLCSDGLTGEVGDDDIAAILGASTDAQTAARALVDAALAAGGRDNVTAIVIRSVDGSEAEQAAAGHLLDDTVERPRREAVPADGSGR